MRSPSPSSQLSMPVRPSLFLVLLCVLLGVVWIAGGASRADVLGQIVVRATVWLLLITAVLFGDRPSMVAVRPILFLLLGALLLALVQLIPLPPAWWQALPGRTLFVEAAAASGQPQPWRPWSIVPGATLNAASSLVVPLATLFLFAGLKPHERRWLPVLLLGVVTGATFVGLLQLSGAGIDNPLVNDSPGQVSGTFANRNHFALLLAWGCVLAPVWAFPDGRRPGWRAPVALALVLLFTLTALASGSRAGLLLVVVALAGGGLLVRRGIRREVRHYPRYVVPALIAGMMALAVALVLASTVANRAVSIDRVLEANQGNDMRLLGLPTVLAMIKAYFPLGSGLGSFEPLFRSYEPFALLKLTYFNHAHDDLLEIALEAGVPGLVLLASGVVWWLVTSIRILRDDVPDTLAGAGAIMLLLVFGASIVDYPVRTPMMMTLVVLAAAWMSDKSAGKSAGKNVPAAPALPLRDQHL